MARLDGNQAAQDHLLEVAKLCCMAALRAPQMTGKVSVQTEIITGEDTLPIIEYAESLLELGMAGLPDTLPTILRASILLPHKERYEAGIPSAFVLVGSSSFLKSELNWNCGACGWTTCAEFNRYSAHIRKTVPGRQVGPCCSWKYMDYIAAVNWAAIVPWQHNVECRMLSVEGALFHALGYLKDCADVQAVGLGPCRDLLWFARGRPVAEMDEMMAQFYQEFSWRAMPTMWNTFFGTMEPHYKHDPRTFQVDRKYLRLVDEPPPSETMKNVRNQLQNKILEIRKKVEAAQRAKREAELPPGLTDKEREERLGPVLTDEEIKKEIEQDWPYLKNVIGGGQL